MNEQSEDGNTINAPLGKAAEQWLLTEARNIRWLLFCIIGVAVGIALIIIAQTHLLASACQRLVIQHEDISTVIPLMAVLVLLAAGRSICTYLMEISSSAAAARLKQSVRSKLYLKIQQLGPAGLSRHETGSLIETITKGVDELEPYFTRFLPQLALAAILPLLFLIIVVPSEWRAGLVLLFSAPFIPMFMILIGRGSEQLHRRQWHRLSLMAGNLLDLIQGLPDLIIFGVAKKEAATVARISKEYRTTTMAVLRVAFLSAFTLEFFATVGTALVAVIVGFRLLSANLTLGEGLFVLLMAPEFYLPLRNLGLSYHARMQGVAAAEQITPILMKPMPEGFSGSQLSPEGAPTVVFESVYFQYGSNRGGISGIDLELPAGSITALAGESGSGKSTLARILAGLVRPEAGRVLINGQDLTTIAPESWRAKLAWVPQSPYFTAGTVRENLLLGNPEANENEIATALQAAAADRFINNLPHGLETALGDRGAGLSGGELKRLALARAYICKATMIILDEPTAGLDTESESMVSEAMKNLSRMRTILIISHREQTLSHVNKIAVMINGRIERLVTPDVFLTPREIAK